MRINLAVEIGLLGCSVLLVSSAIFLVVAEYPITSSPEWESTPRLGDDGISALVTYMSRVIIPSDGFDQADIWYQRLYGDGAPMGTPVQVTDDPTDDQLNDVSGDYIVYTGYQSTTSMTGRITLYQISTGGVFILGSALIICESRIHGNNVVWREGGLNLAKVMYYNLSWLGTDTQPEVLAGPEPSTYCVDIGERFVVWSERVETQYDVVAYDLLTHSQVQVTATNGLNEIEPSTCGMWITWQEQTVGVPSAPIRIIAKNMETGENRIVADNGAKNYRPSIDADAVCYESDLAGNLDVFCYQLSTAHGYQITNSSDDQYLNDVCGKLVAYVDQRNGNEDIFVESLLQDLAVNNIAPFKTIVGQGFTLPISVSVQNKGFHADTLNVTVYAQAQGIDNGLRAYWNFDEGIGTTAHDGSDDNNHGSFASAEAWEWQYTGSLEGWTASLVTDFNSSEDSLNGRTTGTNPNIDSPDNLGIEAARAKTIHVRMKITDTSTPARIYFTTVADPWWDVAKSKFFDLQNAGEWVEYTIDMSNVPAWTGTIKQIRLVPCQLADTSFNIDWLRIGSNPKWRQGRFGNALNFDGVDDQVSAPFIPLNDQSFTVTAWFNAKSLPAYPVDAPLLSQFDASMADRYLHLMLRNGHAYFGFYGDDLLGTATINTNTWYHMAFVYNSTNNYKYIYLNGTLDASGPSAAAYKGISGNTIIGSAQGTFFNGTIDEIRVHYRALTQNEIRAAASSGAVQTQTTALPKGASTTLAFTWNTSGWIKGNYAMSAYAWPVLGETDTVDNTYLNGNVIVAMVGDITGAGLFVPDGKVDGKDITLVAKYFGSLSGHPPNVDINSDGKVDGKDITIVAKNFGKIDP